MYGHFKRQTSEIVYEKTLLRKGNFNRETESLLIAAQKIRTDYDKAKKRRHKIDVDYIAIETKWSIT